MKYTQFKLRTDDQVTLYGVMFIPHTPSGGTIVFTAGFYSKVEDVIHFVEPLGEAFTVISYNLRGSGSRKKRDIPRSEGTLTAVNGTTDLGCICQELCQPPIYLIGHSLGGAISIMAEKYVHPEAVILLNPFIGAQYLPDIPQKGINLAKILEREIHLKKSLQKISEKFDGFFSSMGVKDIIYSGAALEDIPLEIQKINSKVQYFISDNDSVLGTRFNPLQFLLYNELLSQLNVQAENENEAVRGLSHWLNRTRSKAFCSDDDIRSILLDRIQAFIEKNVPQKSV